MVASPGGPGDTVGRVAHAASYPKGTTWECPRSIVPPARCQAGRPPASAATAGKPMRLSQEAVSTERTSPSHTRTIDSARHGDVVVGGLHGLATRGPDGAGDVT